MLEPAELPDPRLIALSVTDPADRWEALGFEVISGAVLLPGVRVELGASQLAVAIEGVHELAGLAVYEAGPLAPVYSAHPNGAIGIDHVVALTDDFDRTVAELADGGLPLKRIRDAGGFRQGFRRLGGPILEVVETKRVSAPTWWGLVVTVEDLDALAVRLGDLLGKVRPAVQPGRRIATLSGDAGLGEAVAFMSPEP